MGALTASDHRDPYRLLSQPVTSDKVFVFNDSLRATVGAQYWNNGHLLFTGTERCDFTYRTRFGPCFEHLGVIACKCASCLNLALRRLTAVRSPEIPGLHELLLASQQDWIEDMVPALDYLATLYAPYFTEYLGMYDEWLTHFNDPHDKRLLRVQATAEMLGDTNMCHRRLWLKSVLGKLKINEFAKPLKWPRMIFDLGVAASLQGFRLMEILKTAMAAESVDSPSGVIQFIKSPTRAALRQAFQSLHSPVLRSHSVVFSDDSSIAIRIDGRVRWFNIDIKSCDVSHTSAVFKALARLFPSLCVPDIQRLIDQCFLPIRIVNPHEPLEKIRLVHRNPIMFSGSTITTAINTLVSILLHWILGAANSIAEMHALAATAGYQITVYECRKFEELQFLKHSPALDLDGVWQPLINFGVFVRASGTCKGDLPGRGPLDPRARKFQFSLLQGMFPNIECPVINRLHQHVLEHNDRKFIAAVKRSLPYELEGESALPLRFTTDSFFSRYSPSPLELDLLLGFCDLTVRQFSSCPAVEKVMMLDYELGAARRAPSLQRA